MIALALALLAVQGSARAESLLAAGDVQAALKVAQKIVEQHPRDARAHFHLGRVHYARPVIGRYPALEAFKTAARLDPNDPEPLYWQMKVGFYLRGDDGDLVARNALLRLFAITPNYLDTWERFRDVYRSPDIWRRAERALARHGEHPIALEHRAELLIALEQGARADSLLAIVTALVGGGAGGAGGAAAGVTTYLLRAEAAFLSGNRTAGFAWHDSALARAENDQTDALWDEAWLIASPGEVARYETTPAGERRAFFERFWGQRDPDLLTRDNERLEEHYARRAEVRRTYRLLHPQRLVYHSTYARALQAFDDRREQGDFTVGLPDLTPAPAWNPRQIDQHVAALSSQALQDAAMPLAFRAGLTAQGLVFLRHGKPDARANCISDVLRGVILRSDIACRSYRDVESWLYRTPDGPMSIRFVRGERLGPSSREQLRSSYVLLRTDRSTLPAPLVARVWSATFRSSDLGLTDVYYKAAGDSAATVVWDTGGQIQPIRASGPGLLQLSIPPGLYHFGLDVHSAGKRGRLRRDVRVPHFSAVDLGLSSLVLAPSAVLLDREPALRGMPVDLVYPAGTPLASYAEIYGLTVDRTGRSRYHLRYSFAPVQSFLRRMFSNARAVVFEFDREIEGRTSFERLIIEPDRLPAGRYRVTLSVTDLTRNVKSESAALDIEIR